MHIHLPTYMPSLFLSLDDGMHHYQKGLKPRLEIGSAPKKKEKKKKKRKDDIKHGQAYHSQTVGTAKSQP